MSNLRNHPAARATAFLLAALLCALHPGLAGTARAADAVEVAVVGVFGHPDIRSSELEDVEALLLERIAALDDVEAIGARDFGRSVWERRAQILQAVFLGSAEDDFQEGRVLYDNAQFQGALISLEKAEESLGRGIEFLRDPRLLVDIHLYEGLANMALGDNDVAQEHFEEVARTDPARTLDPVRTPPKMLEAFEEAKLGVAEAGLADVFVTSGSTPEAIVYVNGLRAGKTPTQLELAPGRYHITVHHPEEGWDYVDETFESGADVELDFLLQPRGVRPLGREKAESSRSRRTQALYRALAETIGSDMVVLASVDDGDNLTLQLFSPRSDVFSREITGVALPGGRPDEIVIDELVGELFVCADASGGIERDATSPRTVPVYFGRNPTLNELLVGPEPPEKVVVQQVPVDDPGGTTVRTPVHKRPLFWVIVGPAGAGGGGGAVAGVQASRVEPEQLPGNGTVTVVISP